jgi:hypothetical protein
MNFIKTSCGEGLFPLSFKRGGQGGEFKFSNSPPPLSSREGCLSAINLRPPNYTSESLYIQKLNTM